MTSNDVALELKRVIKSEYLKQWRANNKDKTDIYRFNYRNTMNCRDKKRRAHYQQKYEITLEQYHELKRKQNNLCGLCGCSLSEEYSKCRVDHDHKTNKIRSIVCCKCNVGLGQFNDDIKLIQKALLYLLKNKD